MRADICRDGLIACSAEDSCEALPRSNRCSARACRPTSGRRLRAVHRPPTCRATAADTSPQPPRRRARSSRLPASTSNLWTKTIRSSKRRSAASGMHRIGPGRAGSTANARPGVARIPAGTRGAGCASKAPTAAVRSRAGMTAHAVPVISASRCATSTGSPAASARFPVAPYQQTSGSTSATAAAICRGRRLRPAPKFARPTPNAYTTLREPSTDTSVARGRATICFQGPGTANGTRLRPSSWIFPGWFATPRWRSSSSMSSWRGWPKVRR